MSDSRIVSIRKSATIDPLSISLPLLYINPQFGYSTDKMIRYIHSSPDVFLKPSLFPDNINEYYWIQRGEPGNKPWYAIGCLEEGLYFFYKAFTNTRFNKDGHMDLWLSHRFSDIIQYAMDTDVYNNYITETREVVINNQNKISDGLTSEP